MTHAVPPGALADFSREAEPAGPPSPPTCRVTVQLGDRTILTYEGTKATVTQLPLGDHGRLVHALVLALNVATRHRPEPSALVETLHAVELMAGDHEPAAAQVALGFVREAIGDAQEFFALDQPAAPLN